MFVALLLTLATPALAQESNATTCVRTKIDNDYKQGWALRTITPDTLAVGAYTVTPVAMMSGLTYRFRACAPTATDVDIILYDSEGVEVTRDRDDNGRPQLDYGARKSGTWYVVIHAATARPGYPDVELAWSISYR